MIYYSAIEYDFSVSFDVSSLFPKVCIPDFVAVFQDLSDLLLFVEKINFNVFAVIRRIL